MTLRLLSSILWSAFFSTVSFAGVTIENIPTQAPTEGIPPATATLFSFISWEHLSTVDGPSRSFAANLNVKAAAGTSIGTRPTFELIKAIDDHGRQLNMTDEIVFSAGGERPFTKDSQFTINFTDFGPDTSGLGVLQGNVIYECPVQTERLRIDGLRQPQKIDVHGVTLELLVPVSSGSGWEITLKADRPVNMQPEAFIRFRDSFFASEASLQCEDQSRLTTSGGGGTLGTESFDVSFAFSSNGEIKDPTNPSRPEQLNIVRTVKTVPVRLLLDYASKTSP